LGGAQTTVGALVFQSTGTKEHITALLGPLQNAYVRHVALCQTLPDADTIKYLEKWSRAQQIPILVIEGSRNVCLARYRESGLAPNGLMLLVEWNMQVHVQSKWAWKLGADELYGVAADQNGVIFDWTPLLLRIEAHCGYLGRFICVDNSYAHSLLLRTRFELDIEAWDRDLIEGALDLASGRAILANASVTRHPPWLPGDDEQPVMPPTDPEFAYAWTWTGRTYEALEMWDKAFEAYDHAGGEWYALYRAGAVLLANGSLIAEASPYLLEAYNTEPRRREPLVVLARAYRRAKKFVLCRLYGMAALAVPFPFAPDAGPHIEVHVYEWVTVDETALCLMELREYHKAVSLLDHVLENKKYSTLPTPERERLQQNRDWCVAKNKTLHA